uniref:Uncharacterized protein n=1 Tax=Physcomitrium patens TaxID=3218 RepID=A0A2K1IF99_PHYPA|nr:hypothetical protein PHYPA_028548 [Physcomitrium patens]
MVNRNSSATQEGLGFSDEKYGELETSASSLMSLSDSQSVFTNEALRAVEPLDDEFGPIDISARSSSF